MRLSRDEEINALKKIEQLSSQLAGVKKIVFFGSRARGNFSGSSDMDLLVIISDIEIKNMVIRILHDIELEYDVPLSPVIFTSREYEINKKLKSRFFENIEKEGIIIYDSEHKG